MKILMDSNKVVDFITKKITAKIEFYQKLREGLKTSSKSFNAYSQSIEALQSILSTVEIIEVIEGVKNEANFKTRRKTSKKTRRKTRKIA